MKQFKGLHYIAITTILFISACASSPQLSRAEILRQNVTIAQLNMRLAEASSLGSADMAPEGFIKAKMMLDLAISSAQDGDTVASNIHTNLGLNTLKFVDKNTNLSKRLFIDLISNRERAINAGAETTLSEDFQQLEKEFRSTTAMVENHKFKEAKNHAHSLISKYNNLEIRMQTKAL